MILDFLTELTKVVDWWLEAYPLYPINLRFEIKDDNLWYSFQIDLPKDKCISTLGKLNLTDVKENRDFYNKVKSMVLKKQKRILTELLERNGEYCV